MIRTKTITAGFGNVSYRAGESTNNPALIFVHGALGDSRLFMHQLTHFGKRYATLALDLPGHGKSDSRCLPTLDHFVTAIVSVLAEENVKSSVLIGHSMGGGICFELYKRGLIPIKCMILVATAPVLPIPEDLLSMVENNEAALFSDMLARTVFSKKTSLRAELAGKGVSGRDFALIRNDMTICKGMDYTGVLKSISVPVLIIANKRDKMISYSVTAEMNAHIHDSRLAVFDLDGHVPFFEYDDQFNSAVDSFFNEIHMNSSC